MHSIDFIFKHIASSSSQWKWSVKCLEDQSWKNMLEQSFAKLKLHTQDAQWVHMILTNWYCCYFDHRHYSLCCSNTGNRQTDTQRTHLLELQLIWLLTLPPLLLHSQLEIYSHNDYYKGLLWHYFLQILIPIKPIDEKQNCLLSQKNTQGVKAILRDLLKSADSIYILLNKLSVVCINR